MSNELTNQKQMTMAEYQDSIVSDMMETISVKSKQGLMFPKNYSPANALASAMLIISQTVDKEGKPVLSVCSKDSIKQCLLDTVLSGLNPMKKQLYYIPYGNKLTVLVSYFGKITMAKSSDPNIQDVFAEVVYAGDVFKYQIRSGYKVITCHEQDPDNIDLTKIKGAYATIVYKDGREVSEYMTFSQIKNSWEKGQQKGQSPAHKLSPEEMSKKSVVSRLMKLVTNTSDDSQLYNDFEEIDNEIDEQQNSMPIDITPEEMRLEPGEAVKTIEESDQMAFDV